MGIKYLNKFLREEARDSIKFISIADISGKKIAVDISIYLYKYAADGSLIENIYLMLAVFRHYNVIPIFIFDGKPPTEKKELLQKRHDDKNIETNGNVFMISGCTEQQTSADSFFNNRAQGAMTWALLESLKTSPTETWRELIKSMRDLLKTSEYDQIPQFASGKFVDIDSKVFI